MPFDEPVELKFSPGSDTASGVGKPADASLLLFLIAPFFIAGLPKRASFTTGFCSEVDFSADFDTESGFFCWFSVVSRELEVELDGTMSSEVISADSCVGMTGFVFFCCPADDAGLL